MSESYKAKYNISRVQIVFGQSGCALHLEYGSSVWEDDDINKYTTIASKATELILSYIKTLCILWTWLQWYY